MQNELRPINHRVLLYFAIAALALSIGYQQSRQARTDMQEERPVAIPLAFSAPPGKPVLRAWVYRKDEENDDGRAIKMEILTLYADGSANPHVKEWNPAKHAPTKTEEEQGYCIRKGELLFRKDFRVLLSAQDRSRLLSAVEDAAIAGMQQAELDRLLRRKGRIRAFRLRAMPGRTITWFELRTNRGHTRLKARHLDWLVEQYDTAGRERLQRILDLRALCLRIAHNNVSRKLNPGDTRKLFDIILTGKRAAARAAGAALWNYAGAEIVGPLLKQMRNAGKARRVRDLGVILSGLGRRDIARNQVQAAMLTELTANNVNTSVNNARLCLALQWCGVFGNQQVTPLLYKFFTDKTADKRRLIAPSPFVTSLLRYYMNTGAMGYTMISARQMAGYALLRLARRHQAAPTLGTNIVELLLDPDFRKQEQLAVLAVKIAVWSVGSQELRTMIAHADKILPNTSAGRLDYSTLLAVHDAINTTDMISARVLRQKPALTSWQAYNLLSRNRYPGDRVMLDTWHRLLNYSGTPVAGALRLRALAAMELWRLRDETDMDNLISTMAKSIANGSMDTYNMRSLDWNWRGTELLLAALERMPSSSRARNIAAWIRRQAHRPAKQTRPEEEDLVF